MDSLQEEMWQDCDEEVEMNDQLFRTLLKRYEAEIEDAHYKIDVICEQNLVIPEHVDITGEVDKLLGQIGKAEEKLSVMRKYYGEKKATQVL
tara:strand:+ start:131 stop:406 length:276 start_codon:yes stop_codon:yes gene_type:complete